MAEFLTPNEQSYILAKLLTELTNRNVLRWRHVDANCYLTDFGAQTFGFCQCHEGLEVNFNNLRFRGYGYGLSELRDAVYKQSDRLK